MKCRICLNLQWEKRPLLLSGLILHGKNLVTGGYQGKMKIEKDSKTGKKMVEVTGIMDNLRHKQS